MNKFSITCKPFAFWLVPLACLLFTSVSWSSEKLALVIGNAEYESVPLRNPGNDSRGMSTTLTRLGFDVIYRENIKQQEMEELVIEFASRFTEDTVGLFYYAGHGVQIKGRNYLLPVDNKGISELNVKYKAMDMGYILDSMESGGNHMNIVIVDACRNNPFESSSRSLSTGLAKMEGPIGSIIAYATAPGKEAQDGSGKNGIYTKHLLEAIETPGLTIERVFKKVRNGVMAETGDTQVPWEESSLTREFYFIPGESVAERYNKKGEIDSPPSQSTSAEQQTWMGIRDSNDAKDFKQFLRQYPDGEFTPYAKRRLAKFDNSSVFEVGASSRIRSISENPVIAVANISLSHPSARLVFSTKTVRSQVARLLYEVGAYIIIDDEQFDDALAESDLEWADLVEDQGSREDIHRMLFNDYFVVAEITSYSEQVSYNSSAFKKNRSQITRIKLNLELRDALTNKVVRTVSGKAEQVQNITKTIISLGPSQGTNEATANAVLESALKNAIAKLQGQKKAS